MAEPAVAEPPAATPPAGEPKVVTETTVPMGDIASRIFKMTPEEVEDVNVKSGGKPTVALSEPEGSPSQRPPTPGPTPTPDVRPPDAAIAPAADKTAPVLEPMPPEPPEEVKSKKGQERYKQFHTNYEKARGEVDRLVKRVAELEQSPAKANDDVLAENQRLKEQLGKVSSVIERTDLLSHPAIQEQFIVPRKQAFDAAAELLKEVDMDPATLDKALSLKGKARFEALDELTESITSPNVKYRVASLIEKIEQKDAEIAAVTSDVKGNLQRLDMEQRAERHRAMQAQEKQLGQMVDMAIDTLRDQGGFGMFLKEIPGNEKWNEGVRSTIAEAKALLTQNTNAQQLAGAAVMAPLAPKAIAWAMSEREGRLKAEKEVADLKGARPGLEGTLGGDKSETKPPAGTNAIEVAMQTLRGAP